MLNYVYPGVLISVYMKRTARSEEMVNPYFVSVPADLLLTVLHRLVQYVLHLFLLMMLLSSSSIFASAQGMIYIWNRLPTQSPIELQTLSLPHNKNEDRTCA